MTWFLVALSAYLFLAIAALADKLVVTDYLSSPRIYMFLASIFGVVIAVLAPFMLHCPGWILLVFNVASGAFFSAALFFFYTALVRGEASRIVAGTDGLVPVVTLILAVLFLRERLSFTQLIAFLLLVVGTMIMAHAETHKHSLLHRLAQAWKCTGNPTVWMLLAAFCFGTSFFLAKIVYETQPFISGLIWIRVGSAAVVLPMLMLPAFRKELRNNFSKGNKAKTNTKMVLLSQGTGAVGVLLQNYAIALGSVVLTTALQGLKYVFLFFFIGMVGKTYKHVREQVHGKTMRQKLAAVILIVCGLVLLVLG